MQRFRALAILAAALIGGSCSYVYQVNATFIDGKLAFLIEDDEATSAPWCLTSFNVRDAQGQTVWEFDAYEAYKSAEKCGPFSPIFYGKVPPGAVQKVVAKPLKNGGLYVIDGSGRGILTGGFRYRKQMVHRLENLPRDDAAAQRARELGWKSRR